MREMKVREMLRELTPSQVLDAANDDDFVEQAIPDLDPSLAENWPNAVPMAEVPCQLNGVPYRWVPISPNPDYASDPPQIFPRKSNRTGLVCALCLFVASAAVLWRLLQ